jgi:hypothetical protein
MIPIKITLHKIKFFKYIFYLIIIITLDVLDDFLADICLSNFRQFFISRCIWFLSWNPITNNWEAMVVMQALPQSSKPNSIMVDMNSALRSKVAHTS